MLKKSFKRFWEKLLGGLLIFFVMPGVQGISAAEKYEKALFAGGCFWCMQPPFEKLKGVIKVTAGYAGGLEENPTYEDYASKGYVEAVEIVFDPKQISYEKLLEVLWHQINPTDTGGQFVDRGSQYRSVIYYENDEQKKLAEQSKAKLAESGIFKLPIATEITKATTFYSAEDYHQDYYKTHSFKYNFYRLNSGRDAFIKKTWGKSEGH